MPASMKAEKNTVCAKKVSPNARSSMVTMMMSKGMAIMPPIKALMSDLTGSFWYLS